MTYFNIGQKFTSKVPCLNTDTNINFVGVRNLTVPVKRVTRVLETERSTSTKFQLSSRRVSRDSGPFYQVPAFGTNRSVLHGSTMTFDSSEVVSVVVDASLFLSLNRDGLRVMRFGAFFPDNSYRCNVRI